MNTEKRAHGILILAIKTNTNLCTVSTKSLPLSHTDNFTEMFLMMSSTKLHKIVDDEEAEQNLATLLGSSPT